MKIVHTKFINEIKSRISEEAEAIAMGSSDNMKEYGQKCGRVQGLKDALLVFEDVWEQYFSVVNEDGDEN